MRDALSIIFGSHAHTNEKMCRFFVDLLQVVCYPTGRGRNCTLVLFTNMKPATFNCTVLRDGHQSLAATRMSTEQMLEIAPILDTMGFSALETWGGATIDSGLRFLGELPFDRLDTLKKLAP